MTLILTVSSTVQDTNLRIVNDIVLSKARAQPPRGKRILLFCENLI